MTGKSRESITAATEHVEAALGLPPARFALLVRSTDDRKAKARDVEAALAPLGAEVRQMSPLETSVLILTLPGRVFAVDDAAAFEAAEALRVEFSLDSAEPDLPTNFFPLPSRRRAAKDPAEESVDEFLGCWAPEQPDLDIEWALRLMRVAEAWQFSVDEGRPDRGAGVVIAQPDTGVTNHPELLNVVQVNPRDVLDEDGDPTDPLEDVGNPGHGTGTASVVVSPETEVMAGSAPKAQHMPIRAIRSVVRITQVSVAEAIEWAVDDMPPDDVQNPEDFRRALDIFMRQAEKTLRKLDREPAAPLDRNEEFTAEAVIRIDGTRPTLLVRDDTINPDHPLAGAWKDTLTAVRERVRERAAAVGRLEPANPSPDRFFGTGWLVDAANGLILTNLHVLHAMQRSIPNAMVQRPDGSFRLLNGGAFIDFAAEASSLARKRFRVVEAKPSGIDGHGFARLDVAVMKVEAISSGPDQSPALPKPIPVIADLAGPKGEMSSFCVIGFPGRPELTSGIVDGVDWDWVTRTLFGNRFGVKRLAPGVAHKPLGTLAGDPKPWVFGHDATTLGGSSGSPILAWRDSGFASFGLHFAGATVDTNCAHAVAQCREKLESLGVPVKDAD